MIKLVPIFSWVLAITSIYATVALGKKDRIGWAVSFVNTLLWAVYSAVTAQWALVALNVVMAGIQIRNYRKWAITK